MPPFESHPRVTRPEVVRWSACAAVVMAAHVLAAFAIMARPDEAELEAGAPVVMIDLAPLAAAPSAPPRDLAAGPLLEAESRERVAEEAQPERQEPEKQQMVQDTPAPDPEVTVAQAQPVPEEKPVEDKASPQPADAAPVPTAPQAALAPAMQAAAPAPGEAVRPTPASVASWQRLLIAQLERHKRYPPQAHGKVGEARLAFSIDRQGRVLSSRIVHSSGSDALDDEALALVKRAQPLPPPPAGLADDQLSFTVPIRYH
jgi:periplasmic protein TonB